MRCALVIAALCFFNPVYGIADVKEIISEGTYNMGDGETPSVAESRALLNAKKIALEQAGTYVESYSKVKNIMLTEDEVQVLASGLMEVEIIDKKRTILGDGIIFWVKIKAKVNPDNMQEMAKRVKEKSIIEDYKNIQAAYEKSQQEIDHLKKQLKLVADEDKKKKVEQKITDEEIRLQAYVWGEKGFEHAFRKEYDEAIEAFTRAIALKSDYTLAYAGRGLSYSAKGEYDLAVENHTLALAVDPKDSSAYFDRGVTYFWKEQYDKAIEDLNKAIAINPNRALVYLARGDAYFKKGQEERAMLDYNKAISFKLNNSNVYNQRGIIRHHKEQHDKAIQDFNKAISIDPEAAGSYSNRGNVFFDKGEDEKAILDYNKAIVLNPNSFEAYLNRGFVYHRAKQYEMAIEDFDKLIAINSEDYRGYYYRGVTHKDMSLKDNGQFKDARQAIEDFSKSIMINPNKAEAFYYRGYLYSVLGSMGAITELEMAIEDFNKFITLKPNSATDSAIGYYARGTAYKLLGKVDMAISDYRKACSKKNQNACKALGELLQNR